jgi:hypothetical protein
MGHFRDIAVNNPRVIGFEMAFEDGYGKLDKSWSQEIGV